VLPAALKAQAKDSVFCFSFLFQFLISTKRRSGKMSEFENQDDFDAFSMDDVDADKPGTGGGSMLPEGAYLMLITEVILKNERGSTQVECEVMAAKDDALVGKTHKEFLKHPDGKHSEVYDRIAKEHLLAGCYAAKTTSAAEVKARQQARKGFDPTWLTSMVGRQVLANVKHDTYTNDAGNEKTAAKIEGYVLAVDNPKGKGMPGWSGTAEAANPTESSPPQSSQAKPVEKAADPFAGLV
jgi:hypothetical protein